ncbi:MAG: branched-chain amino acid ABC transporter substrate-binding protein, partial [Chloroflexota bacterium]
VSPANTYPGLTKKAGAAQGEPEKFYPNNCKRNYSRVVPADDLQGAVGAAWMKELGAKKVFITHDNELYGKGLADVFREAAKKQGLTEAGYEAAPKADNYRALANKIKDAGADFVYYGGITDNNPHLLVRDLKAAAPSIKFMGPDGIAESEFVKGAGASGEGAYITFGGIPPTEYTGKSKEWADKYKAKFAGKLPEPYAIYGYEAAKVVLEAIKKAGAKATDRATVRDNIMATKDFEGVLGQKWSFTPEGDTTITTMAGMLVEKGDFKFVKLLAVK